MQTGSITGYIDVAQVTLYAFWFFFAGLVYYLHREDKREGYPLVDDRSPLGHHIEGFPPMPKPKTFILPHGGTVTVPRIDQPTPPLAAVPTGSFPGAPLRPTGDPMLAAIGPGAYAYRNDEPDLAFSDERPKIAPLRNNPEFFLERGATDPRGMEVLGADGVVAGVVTDLWIDRADVAVRYYEVELRGVTPAHHVLVPAPFAKVVNKRRQIRVRSLMAAQFAAIPRPKVPEQISSLEEDQNSAYFGAGTLYAKPSRQEPWL